VRNSSNRAAPDARRIFPAAGIRNATINPGEHARMTAVTAPSDMIVSQPEQVRTFFARREELILVMKPERPVRGPSGEQVDLTEGIRLPFQAGTFRVPLTGYITSQQGRKIPAADVLEFLDRHRLKDDQFEGFSELAQAAPPVSEEELTAITIAVARGDVENLTMILENERNGWNRREIVRAVEQGLHAFEAILQKAATDADTDEKPRK
jgi:hypothetical protein